MSIALSLHNEFDHAFALPPSDGADNNENMLAVRIAGKPFAMRIADVQGLYMERQVTPLPSPLPELLGIAGFRGQIVPVYDLAALLGYARSASSPASLRWMVLLRFHEPVACAFDNFDGYLAIAPEGIIESAVRDLETVRPIIQFPSILADIVQRIQRIQRIQPIQRSDRK